LEIHLENAMALTIAAEIIVVEWVVQAPPTLVGAIGPAVLFRPRGRRDLLHLFGDNLRPARMFLEFAG